MLVVVHRGSAFSLSISGTASRAASGGCPADLMSMNPDLRAGVRPVEPDPDRELTGVTADAGAVGLVLGSIFRHFSEGAILVTDLNHQMALADLRTLLSSCRCEFVREKL